MLKMLYHGGSCDFRRGQNAKSLQALRYQQKEFGEVVVDPGPDNRTRICLQQLKPCYLNFNPAATITTASTETTACGPYKLIDDVVDNGEREHRRVYRTAVNPPCSLQREIFPFLNDMFMSSDWSQWHSNIMTGRPEEEGRPWQTRSVYPDSMMPAIRMAILLVYLRRVILQDLAVFMAFEGCSGGVDWQHCLFADNPVFASEPFLHFAAEVRASVTLAETSVASAMERHPSSTNAPFSSTEVRPSPSPATGPSQNDLQQQQQQHHLPCDSTSATPSLPLPPTVSTDDEPSICDGDSQEPQQDSLQGPLPEPPPQLLPSSLQEPLPQPFPEPLQESAQEVFRLSHHDQICDAPCQDSVVPSSLLADIVRVEKAAARRQATEGIKMAMVYLDHQARSQTKAVVEFSATAVMSIETLQTRMKTLQDSLQRLQVKKAESKASILA
ncbi:hypothetical protein BGZ97_013169 [Linnemannia gamsii]|jgi:hypothetical protein|uniref:Ndc10 domain-containing protein n=1 Tax=Linnemannia gamsii TaxID=64522 RepID=A0A9P6R1R5_9FUNG|nr:hypothetical protein BGZ97_013169 [Linnemannia gamsii]